MIEDFEIRSKEKAEILSYVKNSINTFIFGPDGIGKTSLIKTVAEEVNNKFGQALCVDCSLYQTANAILREILLSLGSVIASKSNYELIKRLREKTRKSKPFVFLDHFENLKNNDILNIFIGLDFCVCLVSDSFESYRKMGLALKSKYANLMKIQKLSDDQIIEVLKEKINFNVSVELLQKIVERSDGNLTLALNTLKSVEVGHGKSNDIAFLHFENCSPGIPEGHSMILQILKQQRRLPSGDIYRLYCERSEYPKSERSFRKYMEVLCKQGLVKPIGDKKGRSYEIVGTKSKEILNVR